MTQQELKALFVYEPETGRLRRTTGGRSPYPWRGVGKHRRYQIARVRGEDVYLHRMVWLYHYGYQPTMLDHIDGDPTNNRIENLRECTNAQNQYNGPKKCNNKSGFKGVVFRTGYRKPWQARITVGGKAVLLGRFDTPEGAAAAYAAGAAAIAGEFARSN